MRILIAWPLALACTTAAAGSSTPPPPIEKPADAIAYRQSVYRMIRWNFAPMGEMVRGGRGVAKLEGGEGHRRAQGFPREEHRGDQAQNVSRSHSAAPAATARSTVEIRALPVSSGSASALTT